MPGIHILCNGTSFLHELPVCAKEHWGDFESKSGDSHILKHWLTHHGGVGTPKFRIEVIKYCQDALTRQVGEAVRIQYRGQTLNSKSGFNRSGLSRLVLPEPIDGDSEEPACRMDEVAEPRGLNRISRSPTGVKRKEMKRKEYQPKSKKRRKLEYEVIDDNWGLAIGEDMTRIEKKEESRKQFLMAGSKNNMKVDTTIRQSTIRTWSENELFCREIVSKLIGMVSGRAEFMSTLKEELEGKSIPSIRPEEQINRSPRENPEGESSRGPDEHPVVELAENVEEVLTDGWKIEKKKVMTTVKELIQAQKLKKKLQEEEELEKEERMERKKRLEKCWKVKRNHYQYRRWAAELLENVVSKISVKKDGGQCEFRSPDKDPISLFEKNVDGVVVYEDLLNAQECKYERMGKGSSHMNENTKPAVENSIPDGRKVKKKVWMKLKSGLFGWKVITSKPGQVSNTSHTSRIKSMAGQSGVTKTSNSNILEELQLTARDGVGVGEAGQNSELPVRRNFLNNEIGGKSGDKE